MINPSTSVQLETSPNRPALHFTARSGWINDPLALTYHDGRYHLFFQYLPGQTVWGPACQWGHAVSEDLLTWEEHPVVLEPGDGDGGCWSGNLVVSPPGQATIFYTSVSLDDLNIGRIRTAHAEDDSWDTWRKGPTVVSLEDPETTVFRDPQVTGDPGNWRMLMGAGRNDGTAAAMAYVSTDLVTWAPAGDFASRSGLAQDPLWTGTVWECPQLIQVGDKNVLLFSVWEPWVPHYEAYAVGTPADGKFAVESWGRLSYGDAYYAGSTFTDADGHPGLIYWLRGVDDVNAGWAGAHSLPHLLQLKDDVVVASPHPNVTNRRSEPVIVPLSRTKQTRLPPLAEINWSPPPGGSAELRLRSDEDLLVHADADNGFVTIELKGQTWQMPFEAELQMIVDGPVLEIFAGQGVFATAVAGQRLTVSVTSGECLTYRL